MPGMILFFSRKGAKQAKNLMLIRFYPSIPGLAGASRKATRKAKESVVNARVSFYAGGFSVFSRKATKKAKEFLVNLFLSFNTKGLRGVARRFPFSA